MDINATILGQVVAFAIFVWFCMKFVWPPLIKAMHERQEKIGYKIRQAQLQKIPYMLVVGDREASEGTVSVRTRAGGDRGASPIGEFAAKAQDEIAKKVLGS